MMKTNSASILPTTTSLQGKNKIIKDVDQVCDESMSSIMQVIEEEGIEPADAEANITKTLAKNETRAVFCFRSTLVIVLITTTVLVSALVHGLTRLSELSNYEVQFTYHANKVADDFRENARRRLDAIESFSVAITSHALSSGEIWPYVTLPDFERRAYYVLDLGDILSISFLPVVSTEERSRWEKYSVLSQGWFEESLNYQKAAHEGIGGSDTESEQESLTDLRIPPEISKFNGTSGFSPELDDGPYTVWWQFAPVFPAPYMINYNLLSNPSRADQINALLQSKSAVISPAIDISDDSDPQTAGRKYTLNSFLNGKKGDKAYQDGPISDLYIPVFDQFYETNPKNRSVKGILTSYVYWQVYFEDILPENAYGVMAVLENTCNQTYSYLIHGRKARYIGPGDLHESTFNHLEVSTGFGAFLQTSDMNHNRSELSQEHQCLYNVRVYPTKEMQDTYLTKAPLIFTSIVAAAFIFTSLLFRGYSYFVERRQKLVMKTAVQSTQVVNSLFPAQVRERLFEENEKTKAAEANNNTMSKFKIPQQLDKNGDQGKEIDTESAVIADHYENCTVLFADISGFTNWCSDREPAKVFLLLEAIYGAFDTIAKRRGVFKIETIGDCYLAVTGVPEPQKDHAVIMCKFAIDCMTKVEQLSHDVLVPKLGADTASLRMRFGLSSGPITGGVLRGDRARFQLFGDTVNTASRMESNGIPGMIHLNESTAQILVDSGKSSWIRKREDLIEAKGKGTMQTYWLQGKADVATSTSASSAVRSGDEGGEYQDAGDGENAV